MLDSGLDTGAVQTAVEFSQPDGLELQQGQDTLVVSEDGLSAAFSRVVESEQESGLLDLQPDQMPAAFDGTGSLPPEDSTSPVIHRMELGAALSLVGDEQVTLFPENPTLEIWHQAEPLIPGQMPTAPPDNPLLQTDPLAQQGIQDPLDPLAPWPGEGDLMP